VPFRSVACDWATTHCAHADDRPFVCFPQSFSQLLSLSSADPFEHFKAWHLEAHSDAPLDEDDELQAMSNSATPANERAFIEEPREPAYSFRGPVLYFFARLSLSQILI
jgi:hypothetical protein